jgi:hypothetical protein
MSTPTHVRKHYVLIVVGDTGTAPYLETSQSFKARVRKVVDGEPGETKTYYNQKAELGRQYVGLCYLEDKNRVDGEHICSMCKLACNHHVHC